MLCVRSLWNMEGCVFLNKADSVPIALSESSVLVIMVHVLAVVFCLYLPYLLESPRHSCQRDKFLNKRCHLGFVFRDEPGALI